MTKEEFLKLANGHDWTSFDSNSLPIRYYKEYMNNDRIYAYASYDTLEEFLSLLYDTVEMKHTKLHKALNDT